MSPLTCGYLLNHDLTVFSVALQTFSPCRDCIIGLQMSKRRPRGFCSWLILGPPGYSRGMGEEKLYAFYNGGASVFRPTDEESLQPPA